jgi:hypothetical protein
MHFEIIRHKRQTLRATAIQDAIAALTGSGINEKYRGDHEWLMLWGFCGELQQILVKKHQANGGKVIAFDIGYFGRKMRTGRRSSVRVTFQTPHPPQYIDLAPDDNSRIKREKIKWRDDYDPEGHVLLCGLGKKSRRFKGFGTLEWERKQVDRIRAVYPEKKIIFRPKPNHFEIIRGTVDGTQGDIEKHLRGCSLLVCSHSNTAIDAIPAGIPVVCDGGISSALWGNDIAEAGVPSEAERKAFLAKVAWFNWYIEEAKDLVGFIERSVDKIH